MPYSLSTITDRIEQELQDTTNAIFAAAEITQAIADGLVEIAHYDPDIVLHKLTTTADSKELDISGIANLLYIPQREGLEYRISNTPRNWRNHRSRGNNIEMLIDFDPDASETVYLYCAKPHRITNLTDLVGAVDWATGYAAGATTIHIDGLQSSGTILTDVEFTITGLTGVYRLTADATIATNECDVTFYPGLSAAVTNNTVVTIETSSLSPELERLFVPLVAARLAISKASQPIQGTITAISILATVSTALANLSDQITLAIAETASGVAEVDKTVALIGSANTAIGKIEAEVTKAIADLDTGRALIGTTAVLSNPVTDYANYAGAGLGNARGLLDEAMGYFRQANADESVASTYGVLGARSLANASQYLNQAGGYMRRIQTELASAGAWRHYQDWGERKLAITLQSLRAISKPKSYVEYSRA